MHYADELDALVDQVAQCRDIELPVLVVGGHGDLDLVAPRRLQVRDEVAAVFRSAGEDAVPGPQPKRVEDRLPRAGGVLEQRDLVPLGADQARDRVIDRLDARRGLVLRLVAPDLGLAPKLPLNRLHDLTRHQRCPHVVQWVRCAQPGVSARARSTSIAMPISS